MNLSGPFIRRPIATTLVMLSILVFGLFAYQALPVNDLLNVDFPTIQVSANLSGAGPETMASAVATPLERQLSAISGLESMSPTSGQGVTQITLQFTLEKDIDDAAQDVQSAIAAAARDLPGEMTSPPSYRKSNPADSPVIYLALSSPVLPVSKITDYADTVLVPRLSMLSGVAQVQIFGAQKYAVRIQLDPSALASRGLGLDEVAAAVAAGKERHGKLYQASERFFQRMLASYEITLQGALNHHRLTMLVTLLLVGLTVWLFERTPTGLLPSEDTGAFRAITEGAQEASFEDMVRHQQAVAEIIGNDPNVAAYMSSVGAGGSRVTANSGSMFIRLKPRQERDLSVDQVIQSLRQKTAKIPGIQIFMQNQPPIRLEARLTKNLYQFVLQSPDSAALYQSAAKFEETLRELPELQDVTSDLQMSNPRLNIEIDRQRAAALGISPRQLEETLFSAYGNRQVSTIFAPSNQYRVIMELAPKHRQNPEDLSLLHVRSASGKLVPLSAIASFSRGLGPLSVNHVGQNLAVTLSFNVQPGVPLSQAIQAIEKAARASLPASVSTSFQGAAQAFKSSSQGLALLLVMAVLVIYVVLGILYESFIHPLTILSGLPSAAVGALCTLLLFEKVLDLYAFVGIIMLLGIVKKNAIMMIDFAIEARRRGLPARGAIFQGCLVRFRPIMMTTMAALMGTLPIAMGLGAGGDSRQTLGLCVVGGLLLSQALTLYITPVVYLYLDRLGNWFRPEQPV